MIKRESFKISSKIPTVLSIAGSDSSGGAGILADTKTITALGGYASVAITAVTAQNTCGVCDVLPVPLSNLTAQIKAVFDDLQPRVVKLGMLHSSEMIEGVAEILQRYDFDDLVIDPVMVATSGSVLLEPTAIKALKNLLHRASLITPNLPEAAVLLDRSKITQEEMPTVAKVLAEKFHTSVLLKGGHLKNTTVLTDFLYDIKNDVLHQFGYPYIDTKNTHGSGCTLSAAVATYLSQGYTLKNAVKLSGEYLHKAIKKSAQIKIGKGSGAVLTGY